MTTAIGNNDAGTQDFDSMHWQALKKLVEDAGGKWESKPKAIAFLKAKHQQPATTEDQPAEDTTTTAQPEVDSPKAKKAAAVLFDKSKPYGVVSGDIEDAPGARFFQGGHYFNNQGDKVG